MSERDAVETAARAIWARVPAGYGMTMDEAREYARAAIDVTAAIVAAAFVRGVEWCEENPLDREYRFKAAADHADAALPTPPSQQEKGR